MAHRRKLRRGRGGQAVAGGLQGLSQVISAILQNRLLLDRQQEIANLVSGRQLLETQATTGRELLKSIIENPEMAGTIISGARGMGLNLESARPSEDVLAGLAIKDIEAAERPEQLPTERGLIERMRAAGVDVTPVDLGERTMFAGDEETLPSTQRGPGQPDVLRPLLETLGGREESLLGLLEPTRQKEIEEGVEFERLIPGRRTRGPGAEEIRTRTGLTPEEAANLERAKARATGRAGVETQAQELTELGGLQAAQKAAETAAAESARLSIYFSPRFQAARLGEEREKARLQAESTLAVGREKEALTDYDLSVRAASRLGVNYKKLLELTDRINTEEEGLRARGRGAALTIGARLGTEPDVREMQQLVQGSLRQIAMAMGRREANISDVEEQRTLQAIGLSAFATREERNRAMRNLRDLIDLAPTVARQFLGQPDVGGAGERIDAATTLMKTRQQAEQAAIEAFRSLPPDEYQQALKRGFLFRDPVTGQLVPVIQ